MRFEGIIDDDNDDDVDDVNTAPLTAGAVTGDSGKKHDTAELALLQRAFDVLDQTRTGKITVQDMTTLLWTLGARVTPEQVQQEVEFKQKLSAKGLIRINPSQQKRQQHQDSYDSENDDSENDEVVDFDMARAIIDTHCPDCNFKMEWMKAFPLFNIHGTMGGITVDELKLVAQSIEKRDYEDNDTENTSNSSDVNNGQQQQQQYLLSNDAAMLTAMIQSFDTSGMNRLTEKDFGQIFS